MAKKSTSAPQSPKKRYRRSLGDTDDAPIVRVVNRKTIVGGLLKREQNDSVLKDVAVWGLALCGGYFGGRFLLNTIGGDIAKQREENQRTDVITKAQTPDKNPADALALTLVQAINPDWKSDDPKAKPGSLTDADEVQVAQILAGGTWNRGWTGKLQRTGTTPAARIQSREYYAQVNTRYQALTGRSLDYDLSNYLDTYGHDDYNAIKPYVEKIRCTSRVSRPKNRQINL